ncbi:MAG TPA: hypothetical protein VN951_00620 [Pyrinomonadaceae bacterium]|nr:hypothetical protein [Pyrinomonadaceae bacterium]
MIKYEIVFGPGTPREQRGVLQDELKDFPVALSIQTANIGDSVVIGTAILSLTFVGKAFFDAFFAELGKDSYVWVKTKLGIIKARSQAQLNVVYHIELEGIFFRDVTAKTSIERHEKIFPAIQSVYEMIHAQGLANEIVRVELIFDPNENTYIEARLHQDVGFRPGHDVPLKVLMLKE